MSKAKYCKCKNTYTMKCNDRDCNTPYYWKQGIGNISQPVLPKDNDN